MKNAQDRMSKELNILTKKQNSMAKKQDSMSNDIKLLKSSQSVIINNLSYVQETQEKIRTDLDITKQNVIKLLEVQTGEKQNLNLRLLK